MCRPWIIFAVLLWLTTPGMAASVSEEAPKDASSTVIFLPPGAASCRDFLRLEPMQKYDSGWTTFSKAEASNYFVYRDVKEWIRGFFTAANMFHAQMKAMETATSSQKFPII
jgi:hypothetical protein